MSGYYKTPYLFNTESVVVSKDVNAKVSMDDYMLALYDHRHIRGDNVFLVKRYSGDRPKKALASVSTAHWSSTGVRFVIHTDLAVARTRIELACE